VLRSQDQRRALWALGAAGVAVWAAASVSTATSAHVDLRGVWVGASVAITLGFLGVGLFAWARRPDNRIGLLMVAVAYAWIASDFALSDSALLFTFGSAFGLLFIAVTAHLLLAFPTGRLQSRGDRLVVAAAYVTTGVVYVAAWLFVAPERFDCPECPANLFLIADEKEVAQAFELATNVALAVIALAILASLGKRWARATPVERRALAAVLFAGVALMAVLFAASTIVPLTGADGTLASVVAAAAFVPFGLVPYVFLGSLARTRMVRAGALGELVTGLGRAPGRGELRDALARAMGDPSLELAYWLPDSRRYVDAAGKPVELPTADARRAVSEVRLEDRRVAALVHDSSLDDPELVLGFGTAAALALENERLDAELRSKMEELRASHARMIEAGLAERRRLERDLHDGAQQRLVSLALDLRMAERRLATDPAGARQILAAAGGELEAALGELRELARGIHPAVLSDRGLDAALEALAHRAPVPVELEAEIGDRLPEAVELAAYFVVTEGLTNVAKYAQASQATVRATRQDGRIVVEVADDGVGGADPAAGSGLSGLADRVVALDGRLEVRSERGCGTVLRAVIPY
jgi:signal transduction histidine kinase